MFCSSEQGSNLKQSDEDTNIILPLIENSKSLATVTGSELYIDNIKFEYKN